MMEGEIGGDTVPVCGKSGTMEENAIGDRTNVVYSKVICLLV